MSMITNKNKPRRLSPREFLIRELPGRLWLWKSAQTAEAAKSVLATWAGLQRLNSVEPDKDKDEDQRNELIRSKDEDQLNELIRENVADLVWMAGEGVIFDLNDWLRRAEDLERAKQTGETSPEELDWLVCDLFQRLDRASLTLWALGKFTTAEFDVARLAATRRALEAADAYLTNRTDLFLPLADDASDTLLTSRADLFEQEPELWKTLLRHRRIEEVRDTGGKSCEKK